MRALLRAGDLQALAAGDELARMRQQVRPAPALPERLRCLHACPLQSPHMRGSCEPTRHPWQCGGQWLECWGRHQGRWPCFSSSTCEQVSPSASRMPWVHVVACLRISRVFATLACVSSQTSLPPWARHAGYAGAQGRAFEGWAEGPLEFPPTYKFRRGTSLYVGAHCRLQWGENAFLALGAACGGPQAALVCGDSGIVRRQGWERGPLLPPLPGACAA